jgi:N-hydroxyarylamine O-acetyltransferase
MAARFPPWTCGTGVRRHLARSEGLCHLALPAMGFVADLPGKSGSQAGMAGEFRLKDYLERVGFDGVPAADHATLAALQAAHVAAIPFESLNPFLKLPVSLDLGTLQEKMVRGRRGGYCFEQNMLFRAALEAIGFRVTGFAGRVRWMAPPEAPLGPRTHMLLRVDLPEGPWLADVGFGGCLLDRPLRFEAGIEQETPTGTYRLAEEDGLFALAALQPGGWRTMYMFDLTRQEQADYEVANWFTSTNPQHVLVENLIMERVADGRRYKLVNRRLVVEKGGGRILEARNIESGRDLEAVLLETFNVEPPVPAVRIFERLGSS